MEKLTGQTKVYELVGGAEVEIINCPELSILKNQQKKAEILDDFKVHKDDIKTRYTDTDTFIEHKKTWSDFLDECILVQQSMMKLGTPKLDRSADEFTYGTPKFSSLRDYLNEVGQEHNTYHQAVLEYRYECTPAIDELTYDQGVSIISSFLSQKKSIEQILGTFSYDMVKSFITILAKEHEKLHQKKSQSTSSYKDQKK